MSETSKLAIASGGGGPLPHASSRDKGGVERDVVAPVQHSSRPQEDLQIEDAGQTSAADTVQGVARVYITGWKLYVLTFGLCLSLFLSALETTIVSTSLVSITNELHAFEQRDWVVTAYFLTYTGFLVIFAKFSDILGRKFMILLALAIFTVFSIVCGSVSSILQLIIFRAFQGVGASGIYALVNVINPELVPVEKWGNFVTAVSLVLVLSSVLGPILGGVISEQSSWRWVFLLNAPAGVVATTIIAFLLPANFPNQHDPAQPSMRQKLTKTAFGRLDLVGAALLLASSILIVFGFEEAGSKYPWRSPAVVASLAIGGFLFLVFIACEHVVGQPGFTQEPVFPLRLMKQRAFVGLILIGFFTGPPFTATLINLPQRFQVVGGQSSFDAGIHMLAMLLSSPAAIVIAGHLAGKFNVPPFYLMLFGVSMQVLGVGLASSVSPHHTAHMLGYEAIMGFGFGMTLVTILLYVPIVVDRTDLAVTVGAVTQVRTLAGTIGLAIGATVLDNHLLASLPEYLTPSEIRSISNSVQFIETFPESTRQSVRSAFNDAYNAQQRIMLYFCVAALLSVSLLWERRLKTAKDAKSF